MKIINVLVEYHALALNKAFSYICYEDNIKPGMRVKVPFHHKTIVGMVSEVDVQTDAKNLLEVIEVMDDAPLLNEELKKLATYISDEYVSSLMSVYKVMLPPAFKPSSSHHSIVMEDWFEAGESAVDLTKAQKEAYESTKDKLPMKASVYKKLTKTLWKPLLEKGYLTKVQRPKSLPLVKIQDKDDNFVLRPEQKQAIDTILKNEYQTYLLHGVTGSGKTEVFLQLAQKALDQGKQVLFLVPEIGLTPLMIQRVTSRFQQNIAIYHSKLSAQEKYDQYQLVKEKKVSIVVGTRSAVFLPFDNLGLILMDEEHDSSYKQDSAPKYHARDAALFRASYHNCPLILASATPSLESYSRALKKVYGLIELKNRVFTQMPKIDVVNLQQAKLQNGISNVLYQRILQELERKKQVILLLNRRGYLPTVKCSSCGYVFTCPDCGIPLSYHKHSNMLMCHICGLQFRFDSTCPSCGNHHFADHGMGTEKLEEQISRMFPKAHVVRMDADTTRIKNGHEKVLREFEEKGDILIGTQMVAKGLDYSRVSLVGIINPDAALIRQDYRAAETAYEMLEQASGRSGRGKEQGQVIIQSFDPGHYVIRSVLSHSYMDFFKKEMKFRHLGNYPPYSFLCTLIFIHEDPQQAFKDAMFIKNQIDAAYALGPVQISMRQQKQRFRIVIKDKNREHLKDMVWKLSRIHQENKLKSKLDINMHPLLLEE